MNDNLKKQPDIELTESGASGKLNGVDLISREAALACFHGWVDKHGDFNAPDAMEEYRAIEALPSVEPEIIRCKDCKYADPFGHCDYVNFWNGVTDFCSRAERRTDE